MTTKTFIYGTALLLMMTTACENDDKYTIDDFRDQTDTDTIEIAIAYSGNTASVTGDSYGLVTTNGAHVTVNSASNKFLQLTLSGQTTDGSLLVYSQKKWEAVLNGVSIENPQGPAINNQCGKSFYVTMASGTTNTLTDGTAYAEALLNASGDTIDQKATLFSEGQIYFRGAGSLSVSGHAKNGIASDDYLTFEQSGTITVNVDATGSNGLKANDGVFISSGTLTVSVAADGARGIKNDARMQMSGGTVSITTTGDCKIETTNGVTDTTSCAAIKCDSLFTFSGGTLTLLSSGDGGKGINCSENFEQTGGTFSATTTGGNDYGKPKAVKSYTGIILSGGSFYARCNKSWACDNGSDSDEPKDRVTIKSGYTPITESYAKREVIVKF